MSDTIHFICGKKGFIWTEIGFLWLYYVGLVVIQSECLSVWKFICLFVCLSVIRKFWQSLTLRFSMNWKRILVFLLCMLVGSSICLPVFLYVSLSVCLSVCLPLENVDEVWRWDLIFLKLIMNMYSLINLDPLYFHGDIIVYYLIMFVKKFVFHQKSVEISIVSKGNMYKL